MENKEIAVLLTCHNRKEKTLLCLDSFYSADLPSLYTFDIYIVDDGSSDGTKGAINEKYPQVNIIDGDGSLFWAGGMRLAWQTAISTKKYHAYLLLNDDVVLNKGFMKNLIETEKYALCKTAQTGIYSGATIDGLTKETTYGAYKIIYNHFVMRHKLLIPNKRVQKCELTNANILWVSKQLTQLAFSISDILMDLQTMIILYRQLKKRSQFIWHLMLVEYVFMIMGLIGSQVISH